MTTETAPAPASTTTPSALGAPPAPAPTNTPDPAPAGAAATVEGTAAPATEKPVEGAAPAPAPIEVKFPEGVQVDKAAVETFTKLAGELKLDSAGAQKVVDLYAGLQTQAQKAAEAQFAAADKTWAEALKKDADIGGDKLPASLEHARRAVHKFGGPELAKAIDAMGLGNHPALVKAFAKVGAAMAEDRIAGATSAGGKAASPEAALLAQLYPNTKLEK